MACTTVPIDHGTRPGMAAATDADGTQPAALHRVRTMLRYGSRAVLESGRIVAWTAVYGTRAGTVALGRRSQEEKDVALSGIARSYLLRMGPLYMKAGQVLATQSGLLPKRATDEFRGFFSDLPPMSRRDLARTLDRAYQRPVEEVFETFDWRPVAVGSVAEVHLATLPGGRRVAVKVVKRGVRERLWASGRVLAALIRLGDLVPAVRRLDGSAMFGEIRPLLVDQCDMLREARTQLRCRDNFARHPYVRIPSPVLERCSRDVLVMDYMDGVPGQFPEGVSFPRGRLAQRLMDTFYSAVFFHGFYHVDPHPGNLLFTQDGGLVLLDFGLFGSLTEDEKWDLAAFYYACIRKEWDVAVDRLTKAFVVQAGRIDDDPDTYRRQMAAVLRRHFEEVADHWSTFAFFDDATRLLRRYRARVTTSFSLLAIGLLTGEGFVSQTDPDIDVWANARRFTDRFSPYMSAEVQERFDRVIVPAIPESFALRRRAAEFLVAPTHLDRFVLPSAYPLVVDSAEGCRITDVDGRTYIDLSCGYGPHILGYGHPAVARAIADAAMRGGVNALGNRDELALGEQIAQAFPEGSKVILANSGTEAVVMALRLARAHTRRDRVAKFEGHYHGFTDQGMVSGWFRHRGDKARPEPIQGSAGSQHAVVENTLVLQLGEPASLERIAEHADELAAVILEPMPAAMAAFDRPFLTALRELCTRKGIVLVFDEVVTGFRVHYGGVQHLAGVYPDLTTLGKVIGGGLPCGAVVGRGEVIDAARTTRDPFLDIETKGFVGGTLSGNSITAAAGLAALQELERDPGVYERLRARSAFLRKGLLAEADHLGVPCDVKGEHSIFSITFDYASPRFVRDRLSGSNMKANLALSYYFRQHGVYVPELHTLMLGDAHAEDDLAEVVAAFGAVLTEMVDDGLFAH
ncbi:MAG TPA: aminotransferase class III-fold pyridoxal phosphate-dependent enzyme [Kineosporiaceae bacterium]